MPSVKVPPSRFNLDVVGKVLIKRLVISLTTMVITKQPARSGYTMNDLIEARREALESSRSRPLFRAFIFVKIFQLYRESTVKKYGARLFELLGWLMLDGY